MAEILSIDFNQLPRPTRERFVAITQGKAGPQPIFQQQSSAAGGCGWLLLLFVFGAGLLTLLLADFGKPYQPTQPVVALLGYIVLGYLCLFGLLGAIRRSLATKAIPFKAGVYVFPLDTVIARGRGIKLLSARELSKVEQVHHHRNGMYMRTVFGLTYSDGTHEAFSVSGKPQAAALLERLKTEGAHAAEAMHRRDAHQLYPLDPLFEARMASFQPQADSTGPLATTLPAWTRRAGLYALAVACFFGPLGYGVRNLASDELAFRAADDAYDYQAYLYRGWRHVDEVRDELLPRAKLAAAVAKPDVVERVSAIEAVAGEPLVPAVRAEVSRALALALHATYEQAVAAGTVAALREFQTKHPQAADVAAAKQRIHALFQKTLADFAPRASKPGSVPFIESLLRYMERHDSPPLEVRFRRHNAPSLLLADKVLAKPAATDQAGSGLASASSHFDAEHAGSREGAVVDAMQRGFGAVFPTDVLPLVKGEDLDPNDTSLPGTSKPSIFVDYTVGWSGSTYSDPKEGRRFVGIVLEFDVVMTIPNDGKLLKLKLKVLPPEKFQVSYDTFSNPSFGAAIKQADQGPSDSLVYEVMALRAFDELSSKIQDEFFTSTRAAATGG